MGAAPIHTAYHGLITHALPPSSHARVLHLPRASVQPVANATESVVWWFQSVIHIDDSLYSFSRRSTSLASTWRRPTESPLSINRGRPGPRPGGRGSRGRGRLNFASEHAPPPTPWRAADRPLKVAGPSRCSILLLLVCVSNYLRRTPIRWFSKVKGSKKEMARAHSPLAACN